jgi:hypothetical protein
VTGGSATTDSWPSHRGARLSAASKGIGNQLFENVVWNATRLRRLAFCRMMPRR